MVVGLEDWGASALSGPTRFQQRTADYVARRFWKDRNPARRFLVADEVGLGKTIVAKEVIAQSLERNGGKAVDIVYLCSSQPVASQNLKRLKVHGYGGAAKATRVKLLSTEGRGERAAGQLWVHPSTSFNPSGRTGL